VRRSGGGFLVGTSRRVMRCWIMLFSKGGRAPILGLGAMDHDADA
jgi:hypothetical protein